MRDMDYRKKRTLNYLQTTVSYQMLYTPTQKFATQVAYSTWVNKCSKWLWIWLKSLQRCIYYIARLHGNWNTYIPLSSFAILGDEKGKSMLFTSNCSASLGSPTGKCWPLSCYSLDTHCVCLWMGASCLCVVTLSSFHCLWHLCLDISMCVQWSVISHTMCSNSVCLSVLSGRFYGFHEPLFLKGCLWKYYAQTYYVH